MKLKTILMGAAACALLTGPAFAQASTAPAGTPPPPPMHKHHHHAAMATTGSDRLDLLEKRVEEQAEEIHDLKTQLNGGAAAAPSQVTATQFEALQNQVYEHVRGVGERGQDEAKVTKWPKRPRTTISSL